MRRKPLPKPEPPPEGHVTGRSGRFIPMYKQEMVSRSRLASPHEPSWRDDPTYNLRRRKR